MILLAALLAMQAAPPAVVPEDIVVTGRRMARLRRLRMTTKFDRKTGRSRCIFKRRSGDPLLDAAVCDAALACVPRVRTAEEARACVAPTMNALVANGVPWRAEVGEKRPGGE